MKCQHEWRYVPASNIKYGYYTCQKCDADMSETQYEAIQQARQEAAKWVADLLFSPEWEKECHCCEDYYCSICRIKDE